ncbi:MAG: S8 family peptidase [Acidobacteria bacterium]|nr:S8 family peptidase [Acidobacteriota bacterium]
MKALVIGILTLLTATAVVAAPVAAGKIIPDRYIVVLKDDVVDTRATAQSLASTHGARISHVYEHAIKGFSATLAPAAVTALSQNPNVAWIENDMEVSLVATQTNATWGLDRIDQRSLPLNGSYTYNSTGLGVKAYIIDTGVRSTHTEFGGRVIRGYAAGLNLVTDDCNGHGTHVAGTVGGATYGVAKSVTIVPVRVLGCTGIGLNSDVIAGVDWVTGDHPAGAPAVANMSLGGGISSALDSAVTNSINDGVFYGVAAGNDDEDACNYSPARTPAAMTVGATEKTDFRASYSNTGSCLDIFAPGSGITSAWFLTDTQTNTISGTSMATPHVVGAAALYLQNNPTASPATVSEAITNAATAGAVIDAGSGSPNLLLYSLFN